MARKILVLGAGIAGVNAALACRKTDPNATITLLSNEKILPYRKPHIAKAISGKISSGDLVLNKKIFYKRQKLNLELRTEALKIDAASKKVAANTGGLEKTYSYDSLILATGAAPFIPDIHGKNLKGIFTSNSLQDAVKIFKMTGEVRDAAVLGAGYVGLAVANALHLRGINVTLLARSRLLRLILEEDLAFQVQTALEKFGIRTITNAMLEWIGGKRKVDHIMVSGEKIKIDMLVFATGLRPNVKLAEQTGIKIGSTGAIKVNSRMETSVPDIYACGDCAETLEYLTKKTVYLPIGSIAGAHAEVAGSNAAGANIESEGFLRAQFEEFNGFKIASIGLTKSMLESQNRRVAADVFSLKKPKLSFIETAFSGSPQVKIIYDLNSQRTYGAQIVARGNISNYATALLTIVKGKMSLSELEDVGMLIRQRN